MSDRITPRKSSIEQDELTTASEYVRMEADLIAGTSGNPLKKPAKTILIYGLSHELLVDISNELKSVFEPEVEILITTDSTVAHRLLQRGEIDLLLHGPVSSTLLSIFEKKQGESLPALGAALVLLHPPNKEIEAWINEPARSMHLTKAISRLSGSRNV